jgi:hypothetical protein
MAHEQFTTATDRALAQLPEAQRDAASAEAWRRFQADTTGYVTLYDATMQVVAEALALPFEPTAAERKAAWQASQGVAARPFKGGHLVPSGTRAGVVHFVTSEGCSCEAGRNGRRCWHQALVEQQTATKAAA